MIAKIASSGMRAQALRLDVIANNLANVSTTRPEPYRRRAVVFRQRKPQPFANAFSKARQALGNGVEVSRVVEDASENAFKQVWKPDHPDSVDGFLTLPNINVVHEMVDMIDASRAYEANVQVFNTAMAMNEKSLELGRG